MSSENDVQGCDNRENVIPAEVGLASKVTKGESVKYLLSHELAHLIRLRVSRSWMNLMVRVYSFPVPSLVGPS
jgi:hypothetical protein